MAPRQSSPTAATFVPAWPPLVRISALLSLLACLAGMNLFGAYFIGQERYIYGWDSALWWRFYQRLGPLLIHDPARAASEVLRSIRHDDYSLLLVLPLTPFQWLFGSGRIPFILAAITLYIFPAAIVVALLQGRLRAPSGEHRLARDVLLTFATFVLLPAVWIPVLLGSPDIAGAVVMGAILLIYLRRPLLHQSVPALISIGVLCAALILVRRWYAYWVVALFIGALVAGVATGEGPSRALLRRSLRSVRQLALAGAVALLAFFLVATPIAMRILVSDYADMYAARRTGTGPWSTLAGAGWGFWHYMGPLVSTLFLAGAAHGLARKATRGFFVFQVVQLVVVVALFTRVHDIDLHQYSLLIPFMVIAIAGLVSDLVGRATGRLARSALCAVYLLVLTGQFALVFSPGVASHVGTVPLLTSYRHAPLRRDDLPELHRLVAAVATRLEGNDATAYVVASSRVLNDDLLRNACRQLGHPDGTCSRIVIASHWDTRDGLPSRLFTARYAVLATPVQYHVEPAHQRVIGIPAAAILGKRGVGSAFEALPGAFTLDGGVRAVLYERTRPLEEAELRSIEKEFLDAYPGREDLFSLRSRAGHSP